MLRGATPFVGIYAQGVAINTGEGGVLDEIEEVANNTRSVRLRLRAHKGVVNRLGPDCKSF